MVERDFFLVGGGAGDLLSTGQVSSECAEVMSSRGRVRNREAYSFVIDDVVVFGLYNDDI